MLSKGLPEDHYFKPNDPFLPIQMLKLFPESYIVLREGDLPSQDTVVHTLSCFMSEWERITSKKVPASQKEDAYNVRPSPKSWFTIC
jgi:hypothetical protein